MICRPLLIIVFSISHAVATNAQHCLPTRYSELALFDSSAIIIQTNVQYGAAQNYFSSQNVDLMMDVYLPLSGSG